MTTTCTSFIVRHAGLAIAVAFSLTIAAAAQAATAEQRAACTPDAFRLCSSEIPSIDGVTACMRKQKANLSSACKAVFDK